jgi:hypothetical protein
MKPLLIASLTAIGLATAACGSTSGASPGKTITVTATPSGTQSAASATPSISSQPAAGTSSGTPSASAAAPGCLTRYLNGTTGLSQGTAGSIYVVIRFKNLNNVPCTLYGFPGVALAGGNPVNDIGQPSAESTTTTRKLVTLQPGGYANATLQITDAANYPASACKPKNATWLAVIPPNQTIPLLIPWKSTACAGSTKLLTVTAVRPGTGG